MRPHRSQTQKMKVNGSQLNCKPHSCLLAYVVFHTFLLLILPITKFSIVIGHSCTYFFFLNLRVVTWVLQLHLNGFFLLFPPRNFGYKRVHADFLFSNFVINAINLYLNFLLYNSGSNRARNFKSSSRYAI